MNKTKALYFANENKKLRYGDEREIVVGETHFVDCAPKCCEVGLHASKRAIDALSHAPGCILYLVELSGDFDENSDKVAATHRKYLAEFDATELLREFARKQALININKAEKYFNSKEDFNIVLEWLNTGNLDLKESAWSAARSAWLAARSAWLAAESAAESAARSAAWSAAESAAESAAWSAAESAARSAWLAARSARSAAWSAAESAAESAARSAWLAARSARSAAWSAAESAANNMLCEMIESKTGWNLEFAKDE